MAKNNNKEEVWNNTCGNRNECRDYSGRLMKKSAYNNRSSKYSWNIDHIRPISDGGTDKMCNKIANHVLTNDEKGDDFPHWKANGKRFKARRISKNCYKIVSND
ncbi:hypothetical protein KHQ82_08730 [Mycoplasmatota bacterium]|nr:hypothetical protein KHQ82_08730 [Mycoplasmatota bacterium]